ncbi:MAG: hypothetical protein LKE31_03855 [Bacilli bacterium]|jgi:hypothetical protein|nr:hypothetical protein [Bacilli bacterium]
MWNPNEPFDYPMFLSIPLTKEAEETTNPSVDPGLFHRFPLRWKTAEIIADSPFATKASQLVDADIALGEDPYFDYDQVLKLFEAFEEWRKERTPGDEEAFSLVESALNEAKEKKRGISFDF